MTGVISKARALVLGNIHSLLDAAIDLNSPAVVRQYVRDLGVAKEQLADQAAAASGDVANLQRKINEITAKRDEVSHNIDLILGDSDPANDHLARPLAAKLIGYEATLKALGEEMQQAKTTAQQLAEATSRLDAKYQEMAMTLQRLESIDRTAKAKEHAASAISAASHSSAVDNIDNVEDRIQRRGAVADAKLARAMGDMTNVVDMGVIDAQAEALLAQRRAALKPAETPVTEPAA